MTCPVCKTENTTQAVFCIQCGAVVADIRGSSSVDLSKQEFVRLSEELQSRFSSSSATGTSFSVGKYVVILILFICASLTIRYWLMKTGISL